MEPFHQPASFSGELAAPQAEFQGGEFPEPGSDRSFSVPRIARRKYSNRLLINICSLYFNFMSLKLCI